MSNIQDTLEKGAFSEIKNKALAGEKDESGMPYTTIYKMLTGKKAKATPKGMSDRKSATKRNKPIKLRSGGLARRKRNA
jgi:hypothetical protein